MNYYPMFCQEIQPQVDSPWSLENDEGEGQTDPQEACNIRMAEEPKEAATMKMQMVDDDDDVKMRMYKEALMDVEACEREIKDKSRRFEELVLEKQQKMRQIQELERMVRLKLAEADMFQLKADEASREALRIREIVLAKSYMSEEEYSRCYLSQRLREAEAEKQYLYEKMKLEESSRGFNNFGDGVGPSHALFQIMINLEMDDLSALPCSS